MTARCRFFGSKLLMLFLQLSAEFECSSIGRGRVKPCTHGLHLQRKHLMGDRTVKSTSQRLCECVKETKNRILLTLKTFFIHLKEEPCLARQPSAPSALPQYHTT